jgi:hypothetical protein
MVVIDFISDFNLSWFLSCGRDSAFWNFVCLRGIFFVSPLDQNSKITGCCVVFHWTFININKWWRNLSSPW